MASGFNSNRSGHPHPPGGGGGDFQNPVLEDLGVCGDVYPCEDSSYDLGKINQRWQNVYTGDLHLKNNRGDWTIYEEPDKLIVVNNLTGGKYKMLLAKLDE